jgi:hypothetical protein
MPASCYQAAALLGSGNRHYVVALGQKPGQRELSRRAFLPPGDRFDPVDQIQVLLKVLALKPGRVSPVVLCVISV